MLKSDSMAQLTMNQEPDKLAKSVADNLVNRLRHETGLEFKVGNLVSGVWESKSTAQVDILPPRRITPETRYSTVTLGKFNFCPDINAIQVTVKSSNEEEPHLTASIDFDSRYLPTKEIW